ncbi:protein-glutamine gamma-glutamyltransferase [Proteiniborus sp. MB09-C3]|uniref:protein-glutamine gamma-glutamyltransferase n=1 Tax=Proteiniborus sp. MB09-C3 TaxID=3050072 RepID=UPI002552A6FF|nr:protein-glutamine gamma-glutamyltransferase [Proteiniborus sp. MB09-C3]WIV13801.1 protein-glutamine gamma-glutamyltransferase [Proteiniborus sp. MB09-C3]
MIRISGRPVTPENISNQYSLNSIQRDIITTMSSSNGIYDYESLSQLKFELDLRMSIINAARQLNNSNFSFRVFKKSFCNTDYWTRTNEGGFLLKSNVKPSDAINDIFVNGRKYGTECATAMVIIFYKAVLDSYPEELFNTMFSSIHLMNWHYINKNLDIGYYSDEVDYFPGDCRYFKNPDVNPLTPEWQGENTIDLGDGTYYGHGIGISSANGIIRALNRNRKVGATRSAYLMDSATRPGFKYLYSRYYSFTHSTN